MEGMISYLVLVFGFGVAPLGAILSLWAVAIARRRGKRLFWWLWVPFIVLCVAGTGWWGHMAVEYLDQYQGGGETGPLPGAAYFTFAIVGIPFPIGLFASLFLLCSPNDKSESDQ